MYSSYSLLKRLVWVPFLAVVAIQLLFIRNVSSLNLTNEYLHHKCLVSEGKYKLGSEYEEILNDHIRTLSTSNFRSGSYHETSGVKPNTATIIYQCRGDSYGSKCRSCHAAGISAALSEKQRWDSMVRPMFCPDYFNLYHRSRHLEDLLREQFRLVQPKKVSGDGKSLYKETMALLEELTLKANSKDNMDNGKMALYAAGEKSVGTKKLYATVQCMRDLVTPKMCKECLETIIKKYV